MGKLPGIETLIKGLKKEKKVKRAYYISEGVSQMLKILSLIKNKSMSIILEEIVAEYFKKEMEKLSKDEIEFYKKKFPKAFGLS